MSSVVRECEQRDRYRDGLHLIPSCMYCGIIRYIEHGIIPGDFLQAVICNDLVRAVNHCDDVNAELLKPYCIYFINFVPSSCWGSTEAMAQWNRRRGLQGGIG